MIFTVNNMTEYIEIFGIIMTSVTTIIVAILGRSFKKTESDLKKREEEMAKLKELEDKRSARRAKEMRLSLDMMSATMDLSFACCNALCGGTNNGNVEKAKEKALKAEEAYIKFERDLVSEET